MNRTRLRTYAPDVRVLLTPKGLHATARVGAALAATIAPAANLTWAKRSNAAADFPPHPSLCRLAAAASRALTARILADAR